MSLISYICPESLPQSARAESSGIPTSVDLLVEADQLAHLIEWRVLTTGDVAKVFDRGIVLTFLALQLLQARHPDQKSLWPLIQEAQRVINAITEARS